MPDPCPNPLHNGLFQVKDVDVVGWMRITFAPLTGKDFPCFGAVVLSLQEEPMIDFTVGIENASIAVLPGLDSMIDVRPSSKSAFLVSFLKRCFLDCHLRGITF
jgi:hypothetical protein